MTIKEFNALTPQQQRVAVAKDVLERIKQNQYVPTKGTYVRINSKSFTSKLTKKKYENSDLRNQIDKIESCEVCARGAMFLSAVAFNNDFKLNRVNKYDETRAYVDRAQVQEKVKTVFSEDQQVLIETAFEGEDISSQLYHLMFKGDICKPLITEGYWRIFNACKEFFDSYPSPLFRLRAIMKNIVDNNGVFKLP